MDIEKDLDADFLGAVHLQHAGRLVAVEAEIGVREIVHHHGAVMRGQPDDLLEEIQIHALRRRIVRERNQDHLRRFGRLLIQVVERLEKIRRRRHRQHAGVAFGHDDAVLMDRIARVRRDHRIARSDHGEQQVRQRVLRADGDDGFLLRIERDAVVRLVALDDLLAQVRDALGHRVAMVALVARGFHQLADDGARRGAVGVPHPQIHHIELAARAFAFISLMTANT